MTRIVKDKEICGGAARVMGTRVRVADIVRMYMIGYTKREIALWYNISLEAVDDALKYYEKNQQEIDQILEEEERLADMYTYPPNNKIRKAEKYILVLEVIEKKLKETFEFSERSDELENILPKIHKCKEDLEAFVKSFDDGWKLPKDDKAVSELEEYIKRKRAEWYILVLEEIEKTLKEIFDFCEISDRLESVQSVLDEVVSELKKYIEGNKKK